MGKKVDIAEIEHFSDELKEATSNLHTQLKEVKSNIETVNGMNSFSGKAADAAKSYFTDVHLTLLESFGNLYEDLQTNVDQHMKTFRFNVDGNENAIIRSNYLKEIKKEMQKVYEKLTDEDENIYDTIQEVTDISSATAPSFTDVKEWKDNSIDKINEVNEDLTSFTSTGDEADVDEIMHQIEVVMESVQTHSGQSRFTTFSGISMIKELEQLNAYNQLRAPDSDKIVEEISQKLMNGESLNSEEREILYQHIQAELTLEDHKHVTDLALRIDNEEELKNYVNEKVLYSESNLEEEIKLLEKYLYAGNERPGDLPGNTDERGKLRSYLDILKNHYVALNELKAEEGLDWKGYDKNSPLHARVEYIIIKNKGSTKNNEYVEAKSKISIDFNQETDLDKGFTRDSYVKAPIAAGRVNFTKIEYYKGIDAITGIINKEKNKAVDKYESMENELYGDKLLGYALDVGGIGTTGLTIAEKIIDYGNHSEEKSEQKHTIDLKNHEEIATNLSIELKVNERDVPYTWKGKSRQIEVYPTDETFEKLRRWEALHEKNPEAIPYDAEAVNNQDWEKIHETFGEIDSSKHEDLYNYIIVPTPNDNEAVQQVDEELYGRGNE